MDSGQFRDYMIRPALFDIAEHIPGVNTKSAIQLLLVTSGIETRCGYYVVQVDGPALGPYQMEPPTLDDLYDNFLRHRSPSLQPTANPQPRRMVHDFHYATKVARLEYFRSPMAMPGLNDPDGMWHIYKEVWNTDKGATTRAEFDSAWDKYVKPLNWDFVIPGHSTKPRGRPQKQQ